MYYQIYNLSFAQTADQNLLYTHYIIPYMLWHQVMDQVII